MLPPTTSNWIANSVGGGGDGLDRCSNDQLRDHYINLKLLSFLPFYLETKQPFSSKSEMSKTLLKEVVKSRWFFRFISDLQLWKYIKMSVNNLLIITKLKLLKTNKVSPFYWKFQLLVNNNLGCFSSSPSVIDVSIPTILLYN